MKSPCWRPAPERWDAQVWRMAAPDDQLIQIPTPLDGKRGSNQFSVHVGFSDAGIPQTRIRTPHKTAEIIDAGGRFVIESSFRTKKPEMV